MKPSDLHQQILTIIADVFQVELDPSTQDLVQSELEEWDSFNHLRLVSELEEIFHIQLDDDEIPEMTSLERIKELLVQCGVSPLNSAEL